MALAPASAAGAGDSVNAVWRRLRGLPPRDPRQCRVLTWQSLRWVWRQRAFTPLHLVGYLRYAWLRLRRPDIVTEGFVFLGRRVQLECRPGYGRMILGRWVHVGDFTALRAHEGTLRVHDKVVLGCRDTVNCYLDIEIGAATLVADDVYIGDFDHIATDPSRPIKDQGLVMSPIRIGAGSWLGTKTTVLRGSSLGPGSVLAAGAVLRGMHGPHRVLAGVPARVVRDLSGLPDQAGAGEMRAIPTGE